MKTKVEIIKLDLPVDGYNYNAQKWFSFDGNTCVYTGHGKYFKTLAEAEAYRKEQEDD